MHTVIETRGFLAAAAAAGMTYEERERAVVEIAENPRAGDLVKDTSGCRKVRVAGRGKGKSGGTRLLVAHRMKGFIIFLVGRDKSDPGSDFSRAQEDAAKEVALAYERLDAAEVERAIKSGALKEICNESNESSKSAKS